MLCVRSNQRALQCDKCQLWSHTKCAGIADSVYRELQIKDTFSWLCPLCLFAELPATEVIDCDVRSPETSIDEDMLPLTVEVLEVAFRGLRVLHHNVQGLHSKLDELSQWFSSFASKDVVLCFSETWVKPDNPSITIPGL